MSLIAWRKLQADPETLAKHTQENTIGAASIIAEYIKNGAVTTTKLYENAVTSGKSDLTIVASETLRNSNDGLKTTVLATYTKIKEIKVNANLSACRVKFDGQRDPTEANAYGRVYKNGVALGTERELYFGTYATYSEDFTNFLVNDLIQIYAKTGTGAAFVKNMRFYYDLGLKAMSVTNQDP